MIPIRDLFGISISKVITRWASVGDIMTLELIIKMYILRAMLSRREHN